MGPLSQDSIAKHMSSALPIIWRHQNSGQSYFSTFGWSASDQLATILQSTVRVAFQTSLITLSSLPPVNILMSSNNPRSLTQHRYKICGDLQLAIVREHDTQVRLQAPRHILVRSVRTRPVLSSRTVSTMGRPPVTQPRQHFQKSVRKLPSPALPHPLRNTTGQILLLLSIYIQRHLDLDVGILPAWRDIEIDATSGIHEGYFSGALMYEVFEAGINRPVRIVWVIQR